MPRPIVFTFSLLLFSSVAAAPCPDADSDGYADCTIAACDPAGLVCGDCDDGRATDHPGATEVCNHRDDDCVFGVDDGFARTTSCERHLDRYPVAGDRFGWSVAGVGDVDGDGVPDVAVGAPADDRTGWDAGMITMHSGKDRRVLWRTVALESMLRLGTSLSPIADVDGDGIPDVLAGAPSKNAVLVISGADGHEIVRCVEPAGGGVGDEHGVAAIGDLTGDGVPEFAAGATTNNERLHHQGKVTVFRYDRAAGTCAIAFPLWDPEGAIYDNLGYSVAGVGDINGDGVPDIAAGEPGDDPIDDSNGAVLLFSGADGSLLRRLTDPAAGWRDNLGFDVRGIEDINGDGVRDVVASTERRYSWEGEVLIFSGADGAVLRRMTDASTTTGERIGGAIDVVGDVDGDGLDDVLAGARYASLGGAASSGRALVFSSGSGAILGVLTNETNVTLAFFGFSVAGIGDVTGDGVPEFAAGAPTELTAAGAEAGTFSVLSLESVCDDDGVTPFDGDCDDTDSSVWRRPTEARDLRFATGKSVLSWTAPVDPGGAAALVYDTLRSESAGAFGAEACYESGGPDTTTSGLEDPPAGSGFHYLVRAENGCGDGDLGTWGALEWPREVATCP